MKDLSLPMAFSANDCGLIAPKDGDKSGLALRDLAEELFARHTVGRGHAPLFRAFNKALLDLLQVETQALSRIRRKSRALQLLAITSFFGVLFSGVPPLV